MKREGQMAYEATTQTLWIETDKGRGDRWTKQEIFKWTKVLKQGHLEDGRGVKAVTMVFKDRGSAEAHAQTLSFAGIGVYYRDAKGIHPYWDKTFKVEVRTDFGLREDGELDPNYRGELK